MSIRISAASAAGGGLLGFLLAWAAVQGKLPIWIRPTLMTFSGVASNFAGVPLAFAFLATMGRVGLVTVLLKKFFGFDLYATGFSVLSFAGLTLTYLYFQIPLMVLIVTPALDGLKREWREACVCQRTDEYRDVGDRQVFAQPTHFAHVLLVVHRHDHRARAEEQHRFEKRMRHEMEDAN